MKIVYIIISLQSYVYCTSYTQTQEHPVYNRVTIKMDPLVAVVDISAVRVMFWHKFYETVKQSDKL